VKIYLVPLSFGYDGHTVYFHTAKEGKKIKYLVLNPRVCLAFESEVKLQTDLDLACDWTFHYKSAIAYGTAEELIDPDSRANAIKHIMLHYSEKDWDISDKDLSKTKLWRVKLDQITGKKSAAD